MGPTAQAEPADAKRAEPDARVAGYQVAQGFRLRVAAAEPVVVGPAAMAFDDRGQLYVAEWRLADRTFETVEAAASPDGRALASDARGSRRPTW